ncbi:hypothetical protein [Pseudomonas phage UF_RH7]|nr:hypothetical protein [Pseudomonas phage UF_RH7]
MPTKEPRISQAQGIILTGFTGIMMCEFSAFHADVEKRLGRPVFTHELPSLMSDGTLKAAYREDFMLITKGSL